MTRRRKIVIAAIAVAGLAGIGATLWAFFERVETEVERGPTGEARRDPLLAARRLLSELGVPAETGNRIVPPPPADHALLLVAPPGSVGTDEADRLLDWVVDGGRLITTPQGSLLRPLGAAVEEREEDAPLTPGELLEIDPGSGTAHRVSIGPVPRLLDPEELAEHASGPGERHVVLRYRWGEGTVTLLADGEPLLNHAIGDLEHASFLWDLVTGEGRPAAARVVGWIHRASLFAVLRERAAPALVSGLVLIAAWAWRRARRFGPLMPDPPVSRRSLLEHVRASGEFLFRHGRAEVLVAASRRAVQRALTGGAHAGGAGAGRLSPAEVRRRVGPASGLPDPLVAAALEDPPPTDPAAFTRVIKTLEQIRRAR